jgi:hypothetical protein
MQKHSTRVKTVVRVIICGLALFGILWCGLYYYLGIWPPDIASSREMLVSSAQSRSGERFKIVQVRTALPEGYETKLEHTGANGQRTVKYLDGDDFEQWTCSLDVDEERKRLLVKLPRHDPIEYWWDKRSLTSPFDRSHPR